MNKLKDLEGNTFADKAYTFLRNEIINNRFASWEPIEGATIINQLGISRTPIREALKQLEMENLVKIYPKRGTFITTVSMKKIHELFQLRELIEPEVACLVAPYISKDRLSQFQRKLLSIKKKVDKGDDDIIKEAVMLGQSLHDFIISTLGNEVMIRIVDNLKTDIERGCSFASQKTGNVSKFLEQHLEIISALKERNADKAKSSVTKHIQEARKSLFG